MNLRSQIEHWRQYWQTVRDAEDLERNLRTLRWLEDFAFHSKGNAINAEMFLALTEQIKTGEAKLREFRGETETGPELAGQKPCPEPVPALSDFAPIPVTAYPETQSTDFATSGEACP